MKKSRLLLIIHDYFNFVSLKNYYFFFRHFVRRGTFKIDKPKLRSNEDLSKPGDSKKQKITSSNNNHTESNRKLRDLSINVK